MEDPVQRHPTRGEQLDILTTLIADTVPEGGAVLELGCGVGYVAHLIYEKRPDLAIVGVDRKTDALKQAAAALADRAFEGVTGDLEAIADVGIPQRPYHAIVTALTFHDLPDAAKRRVITFAAERLAPGGVFLLYDRVRLHEPALFALQRSVWTRIERVHGAAMRTAESFDAYETDLGTDNRPARLLDYLDWFPAAGLAAQILHLHGNVALIGGARV